MSKVTIVIPCFNLGAYLAEAVDSAQRQTYPAHEIIVVDDGSTDPHTLEVLEQCRRLGVQVHQTENRGVAHARNFGIARANTPYVFCLDADDIAEPTYLAETVPLLDADHEVGMVTSHVEFFGEEHGVWETPEYDPARMLWENCVCGCSLFRKVCWEQVGGYRTLPANEDWDFWIAVVAHGWKWSVVPKPLYRYRKRQQSRSEYEQGNRESLLRAIVAANADFYRARAADLFVGMDSQLLELRHRLHRYIRDSEIQMKHIRDLEDTILERDERLQSLRQRLRAETDCRLSLRESACFRGAKADIEPSAEELQKQAERARVAAELRDVTAHETNPGSTVLVVSYGDDELLALDDRVGWHFPRAEDGRYAGHYPADSRAAIEHLEELRAKGADYLVFPASAFWWLEHYAEFTSYLETQCEMISRSERAVVFSLSTRLEQPQNTFSVVICTYKRPDFIGRAIESVFAQDYPRDKFELIVINNDSPDNTEQVVAPYLVNSPVPISYFVEKRNGLSYARNLGVEKSRFNFVVHLDDDAIAVPNWLASFNAVINEHHALVVGGRVDVALPDGFEPPAWFNYSYPRGFFGLNYREWGREEDVFPIRHPLYLGGGNSAYAKRLYKFFGGYDPRLGRDGKTLLAGEETYLNMVMERHRIPMYYTHDAAIDHHIDTSRITREHLRRKAYWGGVTNAILHTMFFGFREVQRRTKENVAEIKKLRRQCRESPGDPQNFGRRCRITYNLAFLRKFHAMRLERLVGKCSYQPREVAWDPEAWIAELQQLPHGAERYHQLYHFHRAMGNHQAGCEAYELLRPFLQRVPRPEPSLQARTVSPRLPHNAYERLADEICRIVESVVPAGSRVLVVSKGDANLVRLTDRRGEHFPQAENGAYAGYHPKDCAAAIEHLESLRNGDAAYLVFPQPAFWWLDHYAEFREHIESRYGVPTHRDERCVIYALQWGKHPACQVESGRSQAGSLRHIPVDPPGVTSQTS